jgi:hypothetical protein
MKIAKTLSLLCSMLAIAAAPALAQTTISSPSNGATVSSPFTLETDSSTCSAQTVTYVGYSLDNSTSTAIFAGQTMNGPVSAPAGAHTVHVKAWNNYGNVCVTDVSFTVGTSSAATAVVPSYAATNSSLQTLSDWTEIHDGGTPGSSAGTMSIVSSPSLTGAAKLFANQLNDYGGERYAVQFSDDNTSTGFLYDTWVYIAENANGFSNLEFDLEQTMTNGETVIMGFQCDSWNLTWDFAVNAGSPTAYNDTWAHSKQPCNVHSWAPNTWHHVQIYETHNDSGWVTYGTVWLDGVAQPINVTAFSGYELGWGPALITQFQIDGDSAGTAWGNVYLDALTVYRW